MTDEDRERISEYMGWEKYPPECMGETVFYRDEIHGDIRWDLNAAALCVQEMQKRGDWQKFCATGFGIYFETERPSHVFPENYIAFLFNADNFFAAFAKWLKEGDGV